MKKLFNIAAAILGFVLVSLTLNTNAAETVHCKDITNYDLNVDSCMGEYSITPDNYTIVFTVNGKLMVYEYARNLGTAKSYHSVDNNKDSFVIDYSEGRLIFASMNGTRYKCN